MNKFPWNCGECPMLHTYDLSIDDLTHVCLWSKSQIDDCDKYKSAECPMEKHDEQIRVDEINRFQEWFLKTKQYCDYPEDIEWVMEEYREYIKGERENEAQT